MQPFAQTNLLGHIVDGPQFLLHISSIMSRCRAAGMTSPFTFSPPQQVSRTLRYKLTGRSRGPFLIVSRRSPHFHRPSSQRPSPGPPAELRQLIFSAVCRLHCRLPDQHQRAPGEGGLLFSWNLPPLLQSLCYIWAY
jgi:hypothetical protein